MERMRYNILQFHNHYLASNHSVWIVWILYLHESWGSTLVAEDIDNLEHYNNCMTVMYSLHPQPPVDYYQQSSTDEITIAVAENVNCYTLLAQLPQAKTFPQIHFKSWAKQTMMLSVALIKSPRHLNIQSCHNPCHLIMCVLDYVPELDVHHCASCSYLFIYGFTLQSICRDSESICVDDDSYQDSSYCTTTN